MERNLSTEDGTDMEKLDSTVRKAAKGDAAAWAELVNHFEGLLTAIGRGFRLPPDQIQDVAQDTWLQLFRHVDDLRDPTRVGAWLVRTMRNGCLHAQQRQVREVLRGDWAEWQVPDLAQDVEEELIRRERADELWSAVGRLPDRQRDLIRSLAVIESYDGVSTYLGIPIGAIGPTRLRALQRLRAELCPWAAGPAPVVAS